MKWHTSALLAVLPLLLATRTAAQARLTAGELQVDLSATGRLTAPAMRVVSDGDQLRPPSPESCTVSVYSSYPIDMSSVAPVEGA